MQKFTRALASEVRIKEGSERVVTFVASDSSRDSHGTVLNQNGWKLDRYNSNGIVGYQHDVYGAIDNDPDKVIGKGRAYLEDGKLMVDIEFEPADLNPLADKIYRKVVFGSLKAVSVGFVPVGRGKWGTGSESANGSNATYYFAGQELLEISVVNIPSNANALKKSIDEEMEVLRSLESAEEEAPEVEETAEEVKEEKTEEEVAASDEETPATPEESEERNIDTEEIDNNPQEPVGRTREVEPAPAFNSNFKQMEERFLLGEAFASAVKKALSANTPIDVPEERAAAALNGAEASNLAPVTIGELIGPIEKGTVLDKVGAKIQYGLNGEWQYPVVNYAEATIAGESAKVADSTIDLDSVKPTPKTVGIVVPVSGLAMAKGGDYLRNVVMTELQKSITRALNKWLLQPSQVVSGVTGPFVAPTYVDAAGAYTYAKIQALRGGVDKNIGTPDNTAAFVMSNATAAILRSTLRGNGDRMILEGNSIDGIPVFISEYVGDNTIEFGYFSYALVGQFGSMNIIIDPYTLASNHEYRFILNSLFDIKAARAEAFGKMTIA